MDYWSRLDLQRCIRSYSPSTPWSNIYYGPLPPLQSLKASNTYLIGPSLLVPKKSTSFSRRNLFFLCCPNPCVSGMVGSGVSTGVVVVGASKGEATFSLMATPVGFVACRRIGAGLANVCPLDELSAFVPSSALGSLSSFYLAAGWSLLLIATKSSICFIYTERRSLRPMLRPSSFELF